MFRTQPALGTTIEIRVTGSTADVAAEINEVAIAEIARLDAILSTADPESEFSQWRLGEVPEPSPELSEVLAFALEWKVRSGAAFNPMAGLLAAEWTRAEPFGIRPTPERLAEIVDDITEPRIRFERGIPQPEGDASAMELDAITNSWIVDRALSAASGPHPTVSISINAGGDIASRGAEGIVVGVPHPSHADGLTFVTLHDAAIAISARGRRGFTIGGEHPELVLDPRTGEPVDYLASIAVIAPNAATAAVVAIVAGMRTASAAVRYCDTLDGVAALVVEPDGEVTASERWSEVVTASV